MQPLPPLDEWAYQLAFAPPAQQQTLLGQLRQLALEHGVMLSSISPVYRALAQGQLPALTVPAFNLRGLTYPIARALFRSMATHQAGPVMFELAPSEAREGQQSFTEYAAMVLAAALREGYRGPLFLQGDHFGLYQGSLAEEHTVVGHCQQALEAGFGQIDLDASALTATDPGVPFHQPNAQAIARLIQVIRSHPQGGSCCIGAEVGEIGGANTSPSDLLAFMAELKQWLPPGVLGIEKLSVQTGTTHGGVVNADGSLGPMPLDLDLVASLAQTVRQHFGLAGVVQHGASTLSVEQLAQLPPLGVIEVHLATGIQNRIFDHPLFPAQLTAQMQQEMVGVVDAETGREQSSDHLSLQQRFYNARWRAWGVYKQALWNLPEALQHRMASDLEDWFGQILQALRVAHTRHLLLALYREDSQ